MTTTYSSGNITTINYPPTGQGVFLTATTGGVNWGAGSPSIPQITTLQTTKNKIDVDELIETVKTLQERLLILAPMFEKHEKYPALKAAYDHYKIIEKMIADGDDHTGE